MRGNRVHRTEKTPVKVGGRGALPRQTRTETHSGRVLRFLPYEKSALRTSQL